MKANSNQAVLTTLARLGAGMDVVSEGELRRARAAGVPGNRIIFSGVGKTLAEMSLGLQENILCFNVESEPELEALSRVASSRGAVAPIAIRVNPDVDAKTHAKIATGKSENKFGVPISRARAVYAYARGLPGLSVRGVDMHIGSQITDPKPFDDAFALLADFVRTLRADGHAIEHVDLGGGLGIPYRTDNNPPPSPEQYAEIVARHTAALDCKVFLEPGRVIVGNAGALIASVLYVKKGELKRFIIVDAAMNDLVRPTLYEAHHEILPVRAPEPGDGAIDAKRRGRPGVRERRLSRARPRHARGRGGRPRRGDERRRLRRGAGRNLQFPPPGPGGAGQGRALLDRPAAAEFRGIDRTRHTSAVVGVRVAGLRFGEADRRGRRPGICLEPNWPTKRLMASR